MKELLLSDSFIELIGQLTVGGLALFGAIYTLRRNVRAQIVSNSRNEWNILMRNSIAEMLAEAEVIVKCSNRSNILEHCTKFCDARNRVLVRINDHEMNHKELEGVILELEPYKEPDFKSFVGKRDEILKLTRHIMKAEWERVKEEANGR